MILKLSEIELINRKLVEQSLKTNHEKGYSSDDFERKSMIFFGIQNADAVDILNSVMKLTTTGNMPPDIKYTLVDYTESYLNYMQKIGSAEKSSGISFNLTEDSNEPTKCALEMHIIYYPRIKDLLSMKRNYIEKKSYYNSYGYQNTFKNSYYYIKEENILDVIDRIIMELDNKEYLVNIKKIFTNKRNNELTEKTKNIELDCDLYKNEYGNLKVKLQSNNMDCIKGILAQNRIEYSIDYDNDTNSKSLIIPLYDVRLLKSVLSKEIKDFENKHSDTLANLDRAYLLSNNRDKELEEIAYLTMEEKLLNGEMFDIRIASDSDRDAYKRLISKYGSLSESNKKYSIVPFYVATTFVNQLEGYIYEDFILNKLVKNLSARRERRNPLTFGDRETNITRVLEKANLVKVYRTLKTLGYSFLKQTEKSILDIIGHEEFIDNTTKREITVLSSYRLVRFKFGTNMQFQSILRGFKSYAYDYDSNYHVLNILELESLMDNVDTLNIEGSELNNLDFTKLKATLNHYLEITEKYKKINIFDTSRIKTKPFSYQIEGAEFLIKERTCILGDEMGLGKTKTSIIAARSVLDSPLLSKSQNRIAVIITPNTVKLNWAKEIQKVDPFAKILVMVAGQKFNAKSCIKNGIPVYKYIIINYDNLNKYLTELAMLNPTCLIVDEAHKCTSITNEGKPGTIRAANIVTLSELTPFVWLITGTPFRNKAIELFNLLVCINHPLSLSFREFSGKYSVVKKTKTGTTHSGFRYYDELNERLKEKMLRRKKKEMREKFRESGESTLLDLPDKERNFFPVEIDQNAYNTAVQVFMANCAATNGFSQHLVLMGALKKYLSYAKIMHTYEIATSLLLENPKKVEPIVIFSDYKKPLDDLKYLFEKDGFKCCKITGSENEFEKQKNIEDFEKGKYDIALCSIKAAGVGTTLVAASNLIFNDLTWVPFDHFQAEDRVHRVGQDSDVTIYYIYCENAEIDARLAEKLEHKAQLFDAVVDGGTGEQFTVSLMSELYNEFKDKFHLNTPSHNTNSLESINSKDVISDELIVNMLDKKIPASAKKVASNNSDNQEGSTLQQLLAYNKLKAEKPAPLPTEDTIDPIVQLKDMFRKDLNNVEKVYRKVDISDIQKIYEVAYFNKNGQIMLTYRIGINTLYDNSMTDLTLMRITKTSKKLLPFNLFNHAEVLMQGALYDKVFAKLISMSTNQIKYSKEIAVLMDAFEKNPDLKVVIPIL